MTDRKPSKTISLDGDMDPAGLGSVINITTTALRTTLETLAKEHGSKSGAWLDELEERLIRDAEGTIAEGVPIEAEAASIGLGINVLQAVLDVVRENLAAEDQDD